MRVLLLRLAVALLVIVAGRAGAATFVVENTSADGPGSLREAINRANSTEGDDTIVFDLPTSGEGLITLTAELPAITSNVEFLNDRPNDKAVTIARSAAAGTAAFTLLTISSGNTVTIAGLALTNGRNPNSAGAVRAEAATLTLRGCTFRGNIGGGVGAVSAQTIAAAGCSFVGNIGGLYGSGALTVTDGTVTNCSFSGNAQVRNLPASSTPSAGVTPDSGPYPTGAGAIAARNSTILNCTFSNNTAEVGFGAVSCTGMVSIGNSLFHNSRVGSYYGQFVSLGHNISNDHSASPQGNLKHPTDRGYTDLRLGALQRNGGRTPTFALLADSPAIDAGDDALAPEKDQRGFAHSGRSDIGSFEFNGVPPTSLANISTRLHVGTSDNVLIGGFIISGSEAKRLIVRGIGPSLGMAGQLEDPKVEVFNSVGGLIASNDDWEQAPNRQEVIDSGVPPAHPLESALVRSFDPGAYTAIVRGVNDSTGLGLVEIYALDRTADATLANISTRGLVQAGDNVLIGGIIIVGPDPQRVLVRAIGPSLPKPSRLADPHLELYDGNGVLIAENDDWRTAEAEVAPTGAQPSHDAESALVRTLPPAPYTAVVRGKNGATGIALVEVYALN